MSQWLRSHKRKSVVVSVGVSEQTDRHPGFYATDLSQTGAFLRSDYLFELNEELDLEFQLKQAVPIQVRCRVVRVSQQTPSGMGIMFLDVSDKNREAIDGFLKEENL